MFLNSFSLLHPCVQVNSCCLKSPIILTSGTISPFSLSPCPMSEVMSLRKVGHLNRNILLFIVLLVPTSAGRDQKIFNLYIRRWRHFTLIYVSPRSLLTYPSIHISPPQPTPKPFTWSDRVQRRFWKICLCIFTTSATIGLSMIGSRSPKSYFTISKRLLNFGRTTMYISILRLLICSFSSLFCVSYRPPYYILTTHTYCFTIAPSIMVGPKQSPSRCTYFQSPHISVISFTGPYAWDKIN